MVQMVQALNWLPLTVVFPREIIATSGGGIGVRDGIRTETNKSDFNWLVLLLPFYSMQLHSLLIHKPPAKQKRWAWLSKIDAWKSMGKNLTAENSVMTTAQWGINPNCDLWLSTVFENHRKGLIQHCERSELRLHFEWTKVNWKCQKLSIWQVFEKLKLVVKQCYQTGQF